MRNLITIVTLIFVFQVSSWAAVIHVPGDQPTIQQGVDVAVTGDTVLVADGTYSGYGNYFINLQSKAIQVKSENGYENCIILNIPGIGFVCHGDETQDTLIEGFSLRNGQTGISCSSPSSPLINNCHISDMSGAAISVSGYSYPLIANCIVTQCYGSEAAMVFRAHGSGTVANCLIYNNQTHGFVADEPSTLVVSNCSIVDNQGYGLRVENAGTPEFRNCIFWDNSRGAVEPGPWDPVFYYCNKGEYDPVFHPGYLGDYYLSQVSAGQAVTSPCVDGGSGPAHIFCIEFPGYSTCMDELTTHTDHMTDSDLLDLGYHYPADQAIPTPTPVPECDTLGININLSSDIIQAGDTFSVTLETCNTGFETIESGRVYLVLDVYGLFFFWPSWSSTVDFVSRDISPGLTEENVLSFTWPETGSTGTASFIALMTDEELTEALGSWDIVAISWE